jgi:uncharacterized repeat protein (TIGR02543 family)
MIARQYPSFSQAQEFPSASQASNCFVTFDFGADFPPFVLEVIPGRKFTKPSTPPITGYYFGGWFADAGRTEIWDFNGIAGGDNFTLYAKWEAVIYYITYYLNGGANHPANPAAYTVEDHDIELFKPTRRGDAFVAWYADAEFLIPVEVIRTGDAVNVSVYAKFIAERKTVFAAKEAATDRFEGEPKLFLTPDGAEIRYVAGQPVMERGLENQALISLFTREGWCGNVFLPPENKVGSDFEKTCEGSITLSKLADIENSAERALSSKAFQQASAAVSNPKSDNLRVEATVKGGGAFSLVREGGLWKNQRERLDHSSGA